MMPNRNLLLAATMLLMPGVAAAQPVTGVYIGGGAGVNWRQDADVSLFNLTNPAVVGGINRGGTIGFDTGFVGVLNAGYGFGNGLRGEVEFSYRTNDVDSISGIGSASGWRATGTAETYALMFNGYYDFDLGPGAFIYPYIGLGIGWAWSSLDQVKTVSPVSAQTQTNIAGTQSNFAYQGIVGAAIPIRAVPGLSLTAEYRYFATLDIDHSATVYRPTGFSRAVADLESANHSLLLGVRYAFGVAPPPAPVAAAPAPARTFLVFFDWNRDNLTDRARQIIAEAATSAQRVGTTRIEVAGHADTSGNAQYNQRLSERRANNVAAELERRGVPRSAMVIQGFGETRPLVPTGDNVREPQNRRVEIVLR
jgi:outer membrane protein OmpA-like peptidoglycan-associated protein